MTVNVEVIPDSGVVTINEGDKNVVVIQPPISEGESPISKRVLLATLNLANQQFGDFVHLAVDEYSELEFVLDGVVPITNGVNLLFQSDTDGVFDASQHYHVRNVAVTDGATHSVTAGGAFNQFNIMLIGTVSNTSGVNAVIRILRGAYPSILWQLGTFLSSSQYAVAHGYGRIVEGADSFRFVLSGGYFAQGQIRCYGIT